MEIKFESINELYARLNLYKWWQGPLPENSIIFDEDKKMFKTTTEILDDWDDYKDKYIDFDKDWSDEHDEYLNKKWLSQQEVDELLTLIECNLVRPFEGALQSDNPGEVAIHKKITEYNRDKFNQIRNKYSQSSQVKSELKPDGLNNSLQDTCSDTNSSPQCFTSKSEHALVLNRIVTQAWIENRIREEQKKHPTLDWIKLAAIKITKQLAEQKNE